MDETDRKMAKMDCKLNKVKMEVDNQLVTNKNDIGSLIFLQKAQKSFKVRKVSGVML